MARGGMVNCPDCGTFQPDQARFCDSCGTLLNGAAPADAGLGPAPPRGGPPSARIAGSSAPRRRRTSMVAVSGAAIVVLAAALAVTGWREQWPRALFGAARSQASGSQGSRPAAPSGDAPVGAASAAAALASRDPAALRSALAQGYAVQVTAAALAPAGTRIRPELHTWVQRGDQASLRAVVMIPGRPPVTEVVYLTREGERWRVLFT